MTARPQAAIVFAGNNFDTSGSLVGRQSASAGFLAGYLRHGGAEEYACLASSPGEIEGFRGFVAAHAPPGTRARGLLPTAFAEIARLGTLYRPGPDIGFYAWLRRGIDQRAFSVVGVNHTLSDVAAAEAVGRLLTAPVQPWDALVCASRASRDVVQRMLDEYAAYFSRLCGATIPARARLPVIPLGVDCDAFRPPEGPGAARARARAALGVAEDEVALLYFGRFSHTMKANPLPMYLAAEQAAQEAGRRLRLIEAGWFASAEMERGFAQAASLLAPSVPRLVLDGREGPARQAWFAADIFLSFPDNVQESFGLTPLEAMAAGLPQVVSDWDGYRDSVRDGIDGFRVPVASPPAGLGEAIAHLYAAGFGGHDLLCGAAAQSTAVAVGAAAEAIARLALDPDLRRRMGEAARARARASFDWSVVVAAYQDLWADLAEVRRTAAEAAPREDGRAARPLAMDPFALFSGFATQALAPDTRLRLTVGVEPAVARGMLRLPVAAPVPFLLLGEEALGELVARLARGETRVADLLAALPEERRHAGWLTVGWLAKTGLVSWE